MKTNAVGQQGQYGNGDGYHTAGGQTGDAVNNQLYGGRSDNGGTNIVAGTPFLVSTPEPLPPIVHLPPQYVQPAPQYVPQTQYVSQAQYVPQAPYLPEAPYLPQAPNLYQNNVPQLHPIAQQGSLLPPYNVQLPALTLTARSPSGQYVVPMPPKLYVDKPNTTSDS